MEIGFSHCYRTGKHVPRKHGVFLLFDISAYRMYILGVGKTCFVEIQYTCSLFSNSVTERDTVKHFRLRTPVVEAIQLAYSTTSQDKVIAFMNGQATRGPDGSVRLPDKRLAVTGDWVVRMPDGTFDIKKMVELEREYEPVGRQHHHVETNTTATQHTSALQVIEGEIAELDARLVTLDAELHTYHNPNVIRIEIKNLKTVRDYLDRVRRNMLHTKKTH